MVREEITRLEADVCRAIQSSDLLSLLHGESSAPQHSSYYDNHHANGYDNYNYRARGGSRLRQRKDLSGIPKSVLDDRVGPIRAVLKRIDARTLLDLEVCSSSRENGTPVGPRVRDGVYCRPIIDQIRPRLEHDESSSEFSTMSDSDGDGVDSYENDNNQKSSLVRYIHIAEIPDQYTIGIFVFGPGERIPLHDHPEMCVLSRVLYGELQRLSLDLDRRTISPDNLLRAALEPSRSPSSSSPSSSSWLSRSATWLHQNLTSGGGIYPMTSDEDDVDDYGEDRRSYEYRYRRWRQQHQQQPLPEGTKLAYRNTVDVLRAPDVASLYPYEGNLHEFVAGPHGAAVLDVLLPPYDDAQRRDCTFYHIREIPGATANAASQQQQQVQHRYPLQQSLSHEALPPPVAPSYPLGTSHERNHHNNNNNHHPHHQQPTNRQPCLIIPTGQPENFHCISGHYKDLGGNDSPADSDDY